MHQTWGVSDPWHALLAFLQEKAYTRSDFRTICRFCGRFKNTFKIKFDRKVGRLGMYGGITVFRIDKFRFKSVRNDGLLYWYLEYFLYINQK